MYYDTEQHRTIKNCKLQNGATFDWLTMLYIRRSDNTVQHCTLYDLQYRRAQNKGRRGARAGEAEGPHSQSVIRIWREVWSGEGPNGQGWRILLFYTENTAMSSCYLQPDWWFVFLLSRWLWGTTTWHKLSSTLPRKMQRKGSEGSLVFRKIELIRWEESTSFWRVVLIMTPSLWMFDLYAVDQYLSITFILMKSHEI